jgi:hypothetical protein
MSRSADLNGVGRVRLGEIAILRVGFIPSALESRERNRQEEEDDDVTGASRVLGLQPSAIRPDGTVAWDEAVTVLPVRGPERYLIRDGDLLLPLRSQRMQSVVAREAPDGVLAIGQLALVTPHEDAVDTEYLAWYLNHPRTRRRLVGAMMGSSLQFLTMRSVNEFEVDLPDLATQRTIGRVAALSGRITLLEQRLSSARQQLTDALATAALDRAISTRRTHA